MTHTGDITDIPGENVTVFPIPRSDPRFRFRVESRGGGWVALMKMTCTCVPLASPVPGMAGKTGRATSFSMRAEKTLLSRSARRDLRKKNSPLTPYLNRCSKSTSKLSLDKPGAR
jgi:hypothetical protein